MEKRKLLTVLGIVSLVLMVAVISFTVACAAPIEIRYVTYQVRTVPNVKITTDFLAEVEKQLEGQITFKYRGGPEAIPPFDQAMAVKTGAVDMAYVPTGYYSGLTTAPAIVFTAQIPAYQDRESGAYDFMVQIHEKVGLRYLTRGAGPPGRHYHLSTTKYLERSQELARLPMIGGSIWEPISRGLGMQPVAMEIGDTYPAMERGVINVAATSPDTFASIKIWEVAKYIIYPPFGTTGTALIMNADKWKSIPKPLQDLMIDAMFKAMPQFEARWLEIGNKARQRLQENGLKPITFTGSDAEWYLNTINKSIYDFYAQKAPDNAPTLYKLLQKEALKK
jgi:TRAP-type C4-dicarboxylate transport system substrate-binding protein